MIIEVEPGALESSAAACDRAAEGVAGVGGSLRGHGAPDTGRGDTRAAVASVLQRFDQALVGLGATLQADAAALRGSAAGYRRTDSCIAVDPR